MAVLKRQIEVGEARMVKLQAILKEKDESITVSNEKFKMMGTEMAGVAEAKHAMETT